MTEKKLTEAEIMKALECCSKSVGECCAECPLREINCLDISIEQLALDLINRKNAEIAEKDAKIDELQIKAEHLAGFVDVAYKEIEKKAITARAEAIKEFLKKAEEKMIVVHGNDGLETAYLEDDLHQIAKEIGVEL